MKWTMSFNHSLKYYGKIKLSNSYLITHVYMRYTKREKRKKF